MERLIVQGSDSSVPGDVTRLRPAASHELHAVTKSLNRAYDMFMLACDQSVGHSEGL